MITGMVMGIQSVRLLPYWLAWMKNNGDGNCCDQTMLRWRLLALCRSLASVGAPQNSLWSNCFREVSSFQMVEGQNELHSSVVPEWTLTYRTE